MSADNFLGIYKTDRGEFIGRNCWSECERGKCEHCGNRVVFVSSDLAGAITFAQEACQKDIYEYGYTFLNFNIKEGRMEKYWIIFVEHTDGGRHYRHSTLEKAQAEAERLARLPENTGKSAYLFGLEGECYVETAPVKWEIPR